MWIAFTTQMIISHSQMSIVTAQQLEKKNTHTHTQFLIQFSHCGEENYASNLSNVITQMSYLMKNLGFIGLKLPRPL